MALSRFCRSAALTALGKGCSGASSARFPCSVRAVDVNSSRHLARKTSFSEALSCRYFADAPPPTGSRTSFGGFSYPGPRKLKDIVKLPLLNAHGAERVTEIWLEYHKHHASSIADVMNAEEFETLMQRTRRCPTFVLPVPR